MMQNCKLNDFGGKMGGETSDQRRYEDRLSPSPPDFYRVATVYFRNSYKHVNFLNDCCDKIVTNQSKMPFVA
jgi:hypothetical protein